MQKRDLYTAKITSPRLSGVVQRSRLFSLLDDCSTRPVTWVTASAGSGKTTLVASWIQARNIPCLWYQVDEGDADIASFFYYMAMAARRAAPRYRRPLPLLTPEYLHGIPVFTRRYFEELYSRLKPPFVLVLDNYQDVPSNSAFHEMISQGLDVIPEGLQVIILGRTLPPKQFSRLLAHDRLAVLGSDKISFTAAESRDFIEARYGKNMPAGLVSQLHKKTDGWAAGLLLMAESARTKKFDDQSFEKSTPEEIFDYFANEIFDKTDKETQDLLLLTSFLPSVTSRMARELTGHEDAQRTLSMLSRNHYFTDWHAGPEPVYQYHPLFRDFLLNRAHNVFSRKELIRIKRDTAVVLEQEGLLEDAASLFCDAADWPALVPLILRQAEALLTQGRNSTLEKWISSVPEKIKKDSPWLLFWSGVCRVPSDPAAARDVLQQSYQIFRKSGDTRDNLRGILLCCSAIMDTFVYEWNNFTPLDLWIRELQKYVRPGWTHPSPEIELKVVASMAVALMIRQPENPEIGMWFDLLSDLARRSNDENLKLHACTWASNYYYWTGDHARGRVLLTEVRKLAASRYSSPLTRITWMWMETASLIVFDATPVSALQYLTECIQYGRDTGIHLWDHMFFALGVHAALIKDDFEKAAAFLSMSANILHRSRRHGYCHYHYLSAWCHMLKGDLLKAAADAEAALEIAEETGFIFPIVLSCLLAGQVSHEQGRDSDAAALIARAATLCRQTNNMILGYMCHLAEAQIALDSGRQAEALDLLNKAFRLGSERGYSYLPWMYQPLVMSRLCSKALENRIEVEFVRGLVRKCGFVPASGDSYIEDWPYPLKIYTLGEFRLLIDDGPLQSSGKIQQKPLAMMKVLIAFGGKDVSTVRLIDEIWPDADGDSAHKAFEVTLARLRKLLGRGAAAIQYKGGFLSLDLSLCWIDLQMLTGTKRRALDIWNNADDGRAANQNPDEAVRLSRKALALYKGEFLEAEPDAVWAAPMREKMRSGVLQLLLLLGRHWERLGNWEKASECFEKGIRIDNLAEEFYRDLMKCYEMLGRKAEAVRTYKQCCSQLSRSLEITPSEQTDAVYSRIIGKG